MSQQSPLLQYITAVMVVSGLAVLMKSYKNFDLKGQTVNVAKGIITFMSVSLLFFPCSLMLGGIRARNKFFQRTDN